MAASKGESADEHRQPSQYGPLQIGKKVVAPVHRRRERLLAWDGGASPSGEESEALVQTLGDLPWGHDPHPGGRELDRQRDPIKAPADRCDRRCVLIIELEVRAGTAGPVEEQLARRVGRKTLDPSGRILRGNGQRRNHEVGFALDLERFARGCQDPHLGSAGQERLAEFCGARDQVFAVVEYQQELFLAEE